MITDLDNQEESWRQTLGFWLHEIGEAPRSEALALAERFRAGHSDALMVQAEVESVRLACASQQCIGKALSVKIGENLRFARAFFIGKMCRELSGQK